MIKTSLVNSAYLNNRIANIIRGLYRLTQINLLKKYKINNNLFHSYDIILTFKITISM